LHKLIE